MCIFTRKNVRIQKIRAGRYLREFRAYTILITQGEKKNRNVEGKTDKKQRRNARHQKEVLSIHIMEKSRQVGKNTHIQEIRRGDNHLVEDN